MVYNHPVKFGDHRYSGSRDIIFLVCHITLKNHVIKGSFDYIGRSTSRYVTNLPSMVEIGSVVIYI